MSKMKTLCAVTLLAAGALSQPVLAQTVASEVLPSATMLETTDLSFAFEQTAEPVQMAMLSEQEMKETEGAAVPAVLVWAAPHLARGGWGAVGGFTGYTGGLVAGQRFNVWDAARAVGGGFAGGLLGRSNLSSALWGSFTSGVISSWNGGFWNR